MYRVIATALILRVVLAIPAAAQVPPGYEIVTIDPDPTFNYTAKMNNHGQIVYSVWLDGGNTDAIDIFLYDNGEITRLTDDDVYDRGPDINDAGQIVWCRAVDGPGTPIQIVMWQDGELTQLTFSNLDDLRPRINNLGHVVWKRWEGEGCQNYSADIYFYDGQTIHQITNDDWSNQGAFINDDDWITWTRYDFCQHPWDSQIMLWRDEFITQISPEDTFEAQSKSINNRGQVSWSYASGYGQDGIQIWEDGETTTLTEDGGGGYLNDKGHVVFWRWYDDGGPVGAYEVWLYRNGQFLQITDDPHDQGWNNFWNLPKDINNLGEIVYDHGRPWYDESIIKWMRLRLGTAGAAAKSEAINP